MKAKMQARTILLAAMLVSAPAALSAGEKAATGTYRPLHFGHQQHSGLSTASFGALRSDYDDYTSPLYYEAAFTEHLKDRNFTAPVLKAGVDENYWNAGASMQYGNLYGSLVYYNAISNFQNWPANMTDLGLAVTLAYGKTFSAQARYYDFCISGGEGMAMPGLTLAANLGQGDYKVRPHLGGDLCMWHLGPWGNDKLFVRAQGGLDFSRDSMRGFGFSYLAVIPIDGTASKVDIDDVAVSHTVSFWGGAAKDFGRYTVGVRPYGNMTLNSVNPTDVRYWELLDDDGAISASQKEEYKDHEYRKGEYNPYAKAGNMDFLVRLPVALSCRVGQYVTVTGGALFGLYYANFNHYGYIGLGGNNGKGWVPEVGAGLGLGFEMGGASLQVGTAFIRSPSFDDDKYSKSSKQFWRHSYEADDLSLGNMFSAPLSLSLRFSF